VFTRALLPALTKPGLDLPALAVEVRDEVTRLALTVKHDQRPAYYDGTSGGRIFLAGPPPANGGAAAASTPPPAGPSADDVAWSFLKDTRDAEQLRRFIAQFPASPQRREAEERLKTLELQNVANTRPGGGAPQPGGASAPDAPAGGQQVAVVVRPDAVAVPAAGPCGGPVTVSFPSRCAAPLTAAQERGLKPKDTFRECDNCPEMVVVPAGSFTMGSPNDEKGRSKDEGPQHRVTIGKLFAVGKLHVTRDQFAAFDSKTGSKSTERRYPDFAQDGSHPVVGVT
jgi:formylglycine-generating enzyme required for sulfatase activity